MYNVDVCFVCLRFWSYLSVLLLKVGHFHNDNY